jgi:hypothetical protein
MPPGFSSDEPAAAAPAASHDDPPARSYRLALIAFIAATVALAWVLGKGAGLVYLLIYIAATLPGWPLGFALFGRAHALGWVTGALIGYALSCLTIWGVQLAGAPSTLALVIGWTVTTGLGWGGIWYKPTPLVTLPVWKKRDTAALCVLLLLVPALFFFPYKNLGARDSDGNTNYRAYFTADFIWHTALTAEMTKFAVPPVNPFVGDQTLHYYWTYFLVPAAAAARGPAILADVELCLKLNAVFSGVLFLASVMLFTWSIVPSATAAALGTALVTVAASAEGIYALYDLHERGRPFSAVTNLNIDAITSWSFGGLRIDSLARSMWYNPQHSLACAVGLTALPVAAYAGVRASLPTVMLAGIALGGSTIFNPLIGGILSLIYGLIVIADALAHPSRALKGISSHVIPALLVASAVYWCFWNQMVEGSEAAVRFGLIGYARNAPVQTLFLSLGPVLLPAAFAVVTAWRTPLRVWPPVAGFIVGLLLFYFVNLSVEGSYIGFRAGQILQVSLAPLVAFFLSRLLSSQRSLAAIPVALIAAAGAPTTLIDTFNAQDINNRRMGPGFRWTVSLSPQEQQALAWIRGHTSPNAIVQMDPVSRGRETWSHIPTFAHRRMWAGRPLLWLDMPPYEARSRDVHQLYVTSDLADACQRARGRIDYLYMGRVEREGMPPEAFEKFSASGSCFSLAFENPEVRVYRVR